MARYNSSQKALFAFNAIVAWASVGLSFYLMWIGYYVGTGDFTKPTLLGNVVGGNDSVTERFLDWSSYFTILSNIVVAVVMTMLVTKPEKFSKRGSTFWKTLRLDSVLMIAITGVVYNALLASGTKTGLDYWSNMGQHIVNPIVTVLVFLLAGPRGLLNVRTIFRALLLPIVWAAYVLIRGMVINAYPYFFFDAATYGWASVFTFIGEIMVAAVVLGFVLLGYDKAFSRR